jgi:hypothetical protein
VCLPELGRAEGRAVGRRVEVRIVRKGDGQFDARIIGRGSHSGRVAGRGSQSGGRRLDPVWTLSAHRVDLLLRQHSADQQVDHDPDRPRDPSAAGDVALHRSQAPTAYTGRLSAS